MNLFDFAQTASNLGILVDIVSNAAKVMKDKTASEAVKNDASKASTLAKKKIAADNNGNAKGGAVTKMYHGGMAHGKKHMYLGGDSSVKDNAGLRALKLKSPATYTEITGRNA